MDGGAAPQSAPLIVRPESLGDFFVDPDLGARLCSHLGWDERDMCELCGGATPAPLVDTPFVIAQSGIKPEFRGVAWDLRCRGADGRYSPLNTTRTASSHLD